jgi:hypothetical protein
VSRGPAARARAAAAPAAGAVAQRQRSSRAVAPVVGLLAIAWGVYAAMHKAWLCDDAFISFRYADHLAHGLGLVYNAGERVEGYSNLLWTLLTAFGMRLGIPPEGGSIAWGIGFYAATLAWLLADGLGAGGAPGGARPRVLVPVACVLAAVHPDLQRYATGGLETSMFTFLVTAGVLLAVRRSWGARGLAASGLAFALAALTRPDGLLLAPLVAGWVLVTRRPRAASLAAFLGVFLAVWAPVTIAKAAYYGDLLPNTWYAKSAGIAWVSQGWVYVSLYFRRYWALALALPVGALAWSAGRGADREAADDLALALLLACAYTAFVLRVGGDFMYARLLVPATPLLTLALARSLDVLASRRALVHTAVALLAAAAVALAPNPLAVGEMSHGIVDEAAVYTPERMQATRSEGLALRRYFAGLPVTVAIVGSQAALAYYADPAVVIEAGAGLTDRWIARQPLHGRGRIGHEKHATVEYLLQRNVDLTLHHVASATLDLNARLPMSVIALGKTPARIVHWNPALLAELRRRGARFEDIHDSLASLAAGLDRLNDDDVREAWVRLKAFYFDFVPDPAIERAFRERLARIAPDSTGAPHPAAGPR